MEIRFPLTDEDLQTKGFLEVTMTPIGHFFKKINKDIRLRKQQVFEGEFDKNDNRMKMKACEVSYCPDHSETINIKILSPKSTTMRLLVRFFANKFAEEIDTENDDELRFDVKIWKQPVPGSPFIFMKQPAAFRFPLQSIWTLPTIDHNLELTKCAKF